MRGKADLQALMSRMERDALREFCGDRELRRILDYTEGLTRRYVDAGNTLLYETTITRADCAGGPAR